MHWFLKFIFGMKPYMFRTFPLSIIRSFSLYTQQWYMSHNKPVWHIPLLYVQWKTPDDGQRKCRKHVEFYSKNKFEKLVHLVGFIIRIYHDARSPEHQVSCCVRERCEWGSARDMTIILLENELFNWITACLLCQVWMNK